MKNLLSNYEDLFVNISCVNIHCKQYGTGQDVLFLHGTPGSMEDWETLINGIPEGFRITLVDRPGYGKSGKLNGKNDLTSNVKIIMELIEVLELKDVIVVGHSYGACLALAMAANKCNRVKGYVTVGAAIYGYKHAKAFYRTLYIPVLSKLIVNLFNSKLGKTLMKKEIVNAFKPNINSIPEGFLDKRVNEWLQEKVLLSLAIEETELNKNLLSLRSKYKSITSNLHIIQGDSDVYINESEARKLNLEVPHSKLTIADGVGHYVQYVKPELIIDTIVSISQDERLNELVDKVPNCI